MSDATLPRKAALPAGLGEWVLLAVGVVVAFGAFAYRGAPRGSGSVVQAELKLRADDARNLGCASAQDFGTLRCGHDPTGARIPGERPIVPTLTTGRELYFVAGLFQDPEVAAQVAKLRGRPQDRFTARCRLRLVERTRDLRIRFRTDAPFVPAEEGWVADTVACRILEEPKR